MDKRSLMTDAELLAAISAAEEAAYGGQHGELASDRADATDRYLGKVYGNEVAGRSQVVSRDVADVVEGVLANTIKPFVAGDEVVQFTPRGPEDEEAAQQETDYINYIALERNNGYVVLTSAIKDALLLRNGYVKCCWTRREDVMLETYKGQSEEQLAILMSDADVEIVGHTEYPAMVGVGEVPYQLHDVSVRRKQATEYVETIPVPPDEMLVSDRTRAPSLQDADFVQHRTHKTISELRGLGYDIPDDISDDARDSLEDDARRQFGDGNEWDDETNDPSRRIVMFRESWIRIDRDGDGIAELRRVCSIGATLLSDEEADLIPVACFVGTLFQHRHLGVSVYDMVKDVAELKTAMLRQYMDNKYLANNARTVVDVSRVVFDDLLESRPGGVIRVDGDPGSAVVPIVTPDTGPSALQALEYIDSIRENRTGYTRYAQGMASDSLVNKTATGLMQATSQSQMRLEMVSRTIAETGVRDLFRIIHAITLKHSTQAERVRLRNKWVVVNPREWVRRTDLQISVGIGTGSGDMVLAKLQALAPLMQQAQGMGLAGPQEAYNYGAEVLKAAGFKNPDKFIHPPPVGPDGKPVMPQPKPDPAVIAAQEQGKAVVASEQIKAQAGLQKAQMDAEVAKYKIDKDYAAELQKQLLVNHAKLLIESQQGHLEEQRLALEAQKQAAEQQMAAIGAMVEKIARIDLAPLLAAITTMDKRMRAPRRIVRGPDGRAIGVQVDDDGPAQTVQ